MTEPASGFTVTGTIDEICDAVEAHLRTAWETEHPDGFEGKNWDQWQQEYDREEPGPSGWEDEQDTP